MLLAQLQDVCQLNGLKPTGHKSDLVDRLHAAGTAACDTAPDVDWPGEVPSIGLEEMRQPHMVSERLQTYPGSGAYKQEQIRTVVT